MNITNEMIERAIEMSKANIEMEDDVKLTKDNIDEIGRASCRERV